jgi:DNA recombination protein RmuC
MFLFGIILLISILVAFYLGSISAKNKLNMNLAIMEQRLENLSEKLDEKKLEILSLHGEKEANYEYIREQSQQIAILQTREQNVKEMKLKLEEEFKHLTSTMLEESRQKLNRENNISLNNMLTPLHEHMKKLQQNHIEFIEKNTKLDVEIKNIMNVNLALSQQSENLTNALRGDKKLQGNWGEIQLENILEISGLVKNLDYTLQGTDLKLSDEDGKRQMPDVIINLPENKHIVIDSKVSLVAYEAYYNLFNESKNDDNQNLLNNHLNTFIANIKNHIDTLSAKRYHNNEKLISPDYTIMFLPLESAYNLAVSTDLKLHQYALSKQIILVSTGSFFGIIKTIAHILSTEKRNKNAEEIARLAGNMYDKFVGFLEDMEKIEKHLDGSQKSYKEAMNKLKEGRGNLINRADELKRLGIKNTKQIQHNLIDNQEEE